jgi:hypothetical protein
VGRFLAKYIHDNNLASDVRLVDKMLPELAWLAPEFSEACSRDKFVQADASRDRTYPPTPIRPPGFYRISSRRLVSERRKDGGE